MKPESHKGTTPLAAKAIKMAGSGTYDPPVATFGAAGPPLVEQRKKREEEERERQIAERKRYEEQRRRKRDDNRWLTFVQMARQREEAALARSFLEAIQASGAAPDVEIEGKTVAEWIGWAEGRIEELDPINHGVDRIVLTLADVTEWSS